MRVADRIALLCDGRLVQSGTPEELYARPGDALLRRVLQRRQRAARASAATAASRRRSAAFGASHLGDARRGRASASGRSTCGCRTARRRLPPAWSTSSFWAKSITSTLQRAGPGAAPPTVAVRTFGWRAARAGRRGRTSKSTPGDVLVVPHDSLSRANPSTNGAHGMMTIHTLLGLRRADRTVRSWRWPPCCPPPLSAQEAEPLHDAASRA